MATMSKETLEACDRKAREVFGERNNLLSMTEGQASMLQGFELGTQYAVIVDGRVFVLDDDSDRFYLAYPHPAGCAQGEHWFTYDVVRDVPVSDEASMRSAIMQLDHQALMWREAGLRQLT